jgi:crotonobetainyl-CoA:carnitine CoA-transferase CaiB-like acyl-CoA transferase
MSTLTGPDNTSRAAAPAQALAGLWAALGLPAAALAQVSLSGADPVLPSSFAVGRAAQAGIAASALAAAELWHLRGAPRQTVAVEMRHAACDFRSERYFRIDGRASAEAWDKIAGAYPCGDGRWVRLHTNFAHHRDGVLRLLGCAYDKTDVARALQGWSALEFEQAAADAGLVVAALRSFEEWDAHPQGMAANRLPLLTIEKIGEAPPRELPHGDRPLAGVRVLDLTRIIAGPVCGRTLAAHGADVLLVTSPKLPAIEPLVIDTGRGKRSCHIDLTQEAGHVALAALLRDADVFVQGYRPGGLEAQGYGPQAVAAIRPGIVYVSLSAYGHEGPWAGRRGFDSLVQTASGFNHAEAQAAGSAAPRPLPMQALDHAAGHLLACGAMAALARRITEGGSWHVRVSLAQTAAWLRGLGRVAGGLAAPDIAYEDIGDLLETCDSGFGRLTAVRHAAQLSASPVRWTLPAVHLGSHPPAWA